MTKKPPLHLGFRNGSLPHPIPPKKRTKPVTEPKPQPPR